MIAFSHKISLSHRRTGAILSHCASKGRSYEKLLLRQTIMWPGGSRALPIEPPLPMTKAALAVRAPKIGTSSLLSTSPPSPFCLRLPFYHPPHAVPSPPDQLSELPWREQWPHAQAVVHSLTPQSSGTRAPPAANLLTHMETRRRRRVRRSLTASASLPTGRDAETGYQVIK